jgi:hypothetical protein
LSLVPRRKGMGYYRASNSREWRALWIGAVCRGCEPLCLKPVVTRDVPVVTSCVPVVNSGVPVAPIHWDVVRAIGSLTFYATIRDFSMKCQKITSSHKKMWKINGGIRIWFRDQFCYPQPMLSRIKLDWNKKHHCHGSNDFVRLTEFWCGELLVWFEIPFSIQWSMERNQSVSKSS